MKSRQHSVNQIFNQNAVFLSFDRCYMILPCYLHSIYIFASFIGYENYIFEVFSILHIQESKFGRNMYKFGEKSFKKLNSAEFMEFVFSMSVHTMPYHTIPGVKPLSLNLLMLSLSTDTAGVFLWRHQHRLGRRGLCHVSSVMCHVSCAMCHVLCVMYHVYNQDHKSLIPCSLNTILGTISLIAWQSVKLICE